MSDKREGIIKSNNSAIFEIRDNPNVDTSPPWYDVPILGRRAVRRFDKIIVEQARANDLDPDLLRAIMFVENSQSGHYGEVAETIGLADSLLPMNIQPERWKKLGFTQADFRDPRKNIRAAAILLKRIEDRVENPTVAKIASIYVFTGRESVSDYGAVVANVFKNRLWEKLSR